MNAKTQIQKLTLVVVTLLAIQGFENSAFAEDSLLNIEVSENGLQGNAEINADQLLKILNQTEAVHSEENIVTSLGSALNSSEKQKLNRELTKSISLQKKKAAEVVAANEAQIKKLKAERKELQAARLGSGEKNDTKNSKKLFENILAESNLEARVENSLNEVAQNAVVKIRFVKIEGQTKLVSLSNQEGVLWKNQSNREVAQYLAE